MTHDPGFVYLDNAATSFPKPDEVGRAMLAHLRHDAVNPGRAGFDRAIAAGQSLDELRATLGLLCRNPADDPGHSILTANATDALNLALSGICRPGDHVVSTVMEHNSVLRPLWMLREKGVIAFDLAPADRRGLVAAGDVQALMTPRTRLVVMSHASNVSGTIQPVAEVGRLCRERGILFLLDAAQTAGRLPLDMRALGADVVALTGHKGLMGPTGIGALVVGPDVPISGSRWGGTGVRSGDRAHPAEYPWRLEAGTPNAVGAAGLAAGLAWVAAAGPPALLAHERSLAAALVAGCRALPRVRIFGPHQPGADGDAEKGAPMPVVSLTVDGRDPEQIGNMLDVDWGIAVRTGLHCAPLAHEALATGVQGTVRVSFGPFNTPAQVDQLLEALAALAG